MSVSKLQPGTVPLTTARPAGGDSDVPAVPYRAFLPSRRRAQLSGWLPVRERQTRPASAGDRNAQRLLMLLGDADMSISTLLEQGVRSPAQSLYDLQLAGYPIERIRVSSDVDPTTIQYRLGANRSARM